MQKPLSSHNFSELEAFVGMQLTRCLRTYWYLEDSTLEVDSVCLVFANGRSVEFNAFTENCSFYFEPDVDIASEDFMDVSGDAFWKERIGSSITNIEIVHSMRTVTDVNLSQTAEHTYPSAIHFEFSNGLNFELQYDREDDALIVGS